MKQQNIIKVNKNGVLTWRDQSYKCSLGKAGVLEAKREGDGCTPVGIFPLRQVFYRPDRLNEPSTSLPKSPLSKLSCWSDDIGDANYNRLVANSTLGRKEHLWRKDHLYDIIVVIGYNDSPPKKGYGSAIFIHCANIEKSGKYSATEGCVALSRDDLLEILETASPQTMIEILNY